MQLLLSKVSKNCNSKIYLVKACRPLNDHVSFHFLSFFFFPLLKFNNPSSFRRFNLSMKRLREIINRENCKTGTWIDNSRIFFSTYAYRKISYNFSLSLFLFCFIIQPCIPLWFRLTHMTLIRDLSGVSCTSWRYRTKCHTLLPMPLLTTPFFHFITLDVPPPSFSSPPPTMKQKSEIEW